MKLKSLMFCVCMICACTMWATEPQFIQLNASVVNNPLGGPGVETGGGPTCDYCFTAFITDDILSVRNESDEIVNVVVTDLTTNYVVINTPIVDDMEEQLPAGLYQLEIIPTTYAPMEGFFEVEE